MMSIRQLQWDPQCIPETKMPFIYIHCALDIFFKCISQNFINNLWIYIGQLEISVIKINYNLCVFQFQRLKKYIFLNTNAYSSWNYCHTFLKLVSSRRTRKLIIVLYPNYIYIYLISYFYFNICSPRHDTKLQLLKAIYSFICLFLISHL